MPNTDNIARWVEALESGQYEQAKGVLARRGEDGKVRYCCLGVACDVAMRNGVNLHTEDSETIEGSPVIVYDGWDGILPEAVADWLGFDNQNPVLTTSLLGGGSTTASSMNDGLGFAFTRIAQAVRETFLADA